MYATKSGSFCTKRPSTPLWCCCRHSSSSHSLAHLLLPAGKRAMQVALEARRVEVRVLREDARVKQEELLRALTEIQVGSLDVETGARMGG